MLMCGFLWFCSTWGSLTKVLIYLLVHYSHYLGWDWGLIKMGSTWWAQEFILLKLNGVIFQVLCYDLQDSFCSLWPSFQLYDQKVKSFFPQKVKSLVTLLFMKLHGFDPSSGAEQHENQKKFTALLLVNELCWQHINNPNTQELFIFSSIYISDKLLVIHP